MLIPYERQKQSLGCSPWRITASLAISQIFMEAQERREIPIARKFVLVFIFK
jgi:hypothetical protein